MIDVKKSEEECKIKDHALLLVMKVQAVEVEEKKVIGHATLHVIEVEEMKKSRGR